MQFTGDIGVAWGVGSIVRGFWQAWLRFSGRSVVWQAVKLLLRVQQPLSLTRWITVRPNGQRMPDVAEAANRLWACGHHVLCIVVLELREPMPSLGRYCGMICFIFACLIRVTCELIPSNCGERAADTTVSCRGAVLRLTRAPAEGRSGRGGRACAPRAAYNDPPLRLAPSPPGGYVRRLSNTLLALAVLGRRLGASCPWADGTWVAARCWRLRQRGPLRGAVVRGFLPRPWTPAQGGRLTLFL